ncbi:hypothetical protein ACNOYE_32725 [Nannocystaceae bacterium ST9]
MPAPTEHPSLAVPAVLVGLGEFGARVAERLLAEQRAGRSRGALEVDDVQGDEDLGLIVARSELDVASLADAVLVRVRKALAHRRLVGLRDAAASEHQTRLTILVFGQLGEPIVRERLWPVLAALQSKLLAELGPIFEAYRVGAARRGVILPLLAMPHPPSDPQGPAITTCVRSLIAAVAATPARTRAVPQVYLIEDVAEFSVLSPAELEQCVRNFASLLLHVDPQGEAGEFVDRLLHGGQPHEPLASFVCAVAELPRTKLAAYGRDRVALELLDAVLAAPRVEHSLSEADALEELEAESFRRDDEAEQDVREVLGRYAPKIHPDPAPLWWQRGALTRERLGPDPGDASLIAAQPPAAKPSGWLEARMREIEATWRLLQRRRFDDVVARDRQQIEQWRDGLLVRLRKRVDRELWSDPSPSSLRRTEELVARLRRAFGEQLEDAVRLRDQAKPVPPPDFEELRDAHARTLDAARRKPDPDRMALWGALALLACLLFVPPVLAMIADGLSIDPGHWYEPLFRARGWLSAGLIGVLGIGGWIAWKLGRAHLDLLAALDRLWEALRETIDGERGSLLEYFSTRLRLSRAIARVEALLAVQAALDADSETLLLIDKAARRARGELRDHLRVLGVEIGSTPSEDDIGRLLGRGGESLVEPFVAEQGAREIVDALPPEGRESRVHDQLAAIARHYGVGDRWREELPFADLARLRSAAEIHAQPIAQWDPLAGAERAEATAERLAAFVRRQRRSLRNALNFTGYEALDADGVARTLRQEGEAIVPRAAIELVRDRARAGQDSLTLRPGDEKDRAYYVVAASGIAEASVASLRSLPSVERETP